MSESRRANTSQALVLPPDPIENDRSLVALIALICLEMLIGVPQIFRRLKDVVAACVHCAVESLPVVVVSTAFAGMVVTHEIAWHMDLALHTVEMVPGFTGQFILRELAVAVPALLLVAKVGASIAAEVGTMRVTDQIDALRLLGIHPIRYIVLPRWIGTVFAGATLTLISTLVTLACAIAVAQFNYGFGLGEYLIHLRKFIGLKDVLCALIKGTIYGGVIPIIACAYGFRCKRGAEGVGMATTQSVVTSTMVVITLDFILTYLFTKWFYEN